MYNFLSVTSITALDADKFIPSIFFQVLFSYFCMKTLLFCKKSVYDTYTFPLLSLKEGSTTYPVCILFPMHSNLFVFEFNLNTFKYALPSFINVVLPFVIAIYTPLLVAIISEY